MPSFPVQAIRAPWVPPITSSVSYHSEGPVLVPPVDALGIKEVRPLSQKKICDCPLTPGFGPSHTTRPPNADGLLLSPPVLLVRARVVTPSHHMIWLRLPSYCTHARFGLPVLGST